MKANIGWETAKFATACAGPASVVFHIHLFREYFDAARPSPDSLYSVALNNHGVDRYITEAQSRNLDVSLGVAVVLLIVFFGIVVAKLRGDRQ